MGWYGPQSGDCSCCGCTRTDGLCLGDSPNYYPEVEVELPPWTVTDGSCGGCAGLTLHGTFVLPLLSIIGTTVTYEYVETNLLNTGCTCSPPSTPHYTLENVAIFSIQFTAFQASTFRDECCGFSVRIYVNESEVGTPPLGNSGASHVLARYQNALLASGQSMTLSQKESTFADNQHFLCLCNYGSGPDWAKVTIP